MIFFKPVKCWFIDYHWETYFIKVIKHFISLNLDKKVKSFDYFQSDFSCHIKNQLKYVHGKSLIIFGQNYLKFLIWFREEKK